MDDVLDACCLLRPDHNRIEVGMGTADAVHPDTRRLFADRLCHQKDNDAEDSPDLLE